MKNLTFADVLIEPQFSLIKSRKDVSLYSNVGNLGLNLPIISAPMDTITGPQMAKALDKAGASGCLHRFQSIEENVAEYKASECNPIVSVGLNDWDRVEALYHAGADRFLLDVAHGAQYQVVEWVAQFRHKYYNTWLMVGNFATGKQIQDFMSYTARVDAWRVGVGGGAACTTRVKTGCGVPTLGSLLSIKEVNGMHGVKKIENVVADGGIKTPGDVAKALAAGASAVMVGRMLAGTLETPGPIIEEAPLFGACSSNWVPKKWKSYRGSASKESYEAQGKVQEYITAEGESYTVPYKGPVLSTLQDVEGGLRSAFTYVGASNLKQFQEKAVLFQITQNGYTEGTAHGK